MNVSAEIAAQPGDADPLSGFFSEFLEPQTFAEFRSVGRLFAALRDKGKTVSGYPVIRPHDCARVTRTLEGIFEACREQFRTRDIALTNRFERLVAAFHDYCASIYPSEAGALLLLHGRVLLFMGEAERAIEVLSPLALRPYAVHGDLGQRAKLVELLGQAHLRQGTLRELPISFLAFGAWLIAQRRGITIPDAATRMAPFVNFEPVSPVAPVSSRLVRWASAAYMSAKRRRNGFLSRVACALTAQLYLGLLCIGYALLAHRARCSSPFSLRMRADGPILVARAMGGIGDLLTMQPGLEVLARTHGQPVDFAIPKKFFPLFSHDPNIRLIDIDGPVIDISRYRAFYDLGLCPASRYESRRRPNVRRGRVELFARGMGVNPSQLRSQGWRINRVRSPDEDDFCDRFLAAHGLGGRPLIGVQPYSRDSYKDHTGIAKIIGELAKTYDIIIFHHVIDGIPQGPGLANTAGLPLSDSLALLSRLQVMVSVDSAFLHAAAAYDVPVIALFGPTGALTVTRHHRKVTILWKPEIFGCVPCWRNEDLPCRVTGAVSTSPCIAAITPEDVSRAVAEAIGSSP